MGDESFCVQANAAKGRCRHEGEDEDDDVDDGSDIGGDAVRPRRTCPEVGILVVQSHSVGNRCTRAVGKVVEQMTLGLA